MAHPGGDAAGQFAATLSRLTGERAHGLTSAVKGRRQASGGSILTQRVAGQDPACHMGDISLTGPDRLVSRPPTQRLDMARDEIQPVKPGIGNQ